MDAGEAREDLWASVGLTGALKEGAAKEKFWGLAEQGIGQICWREAKAGPVSRGPSYVKLCERGFHLKICPAGQWWLTPVILAAQEGATRRIIV
jgi:hypothetical protein